MHGQQNTKICALIWSFTKIILRCTVSKTSKYQRRRLTTTTSFAASSNTKPEDREINKFGLKIFKI